MFSKHFDEWKARFGEVPTPCSRAFMDTRKIGFHQLPRIELQFSNEPRWKFESTRVSLEVDIRESPEICKSCYERTLECFPITWYYIKNQSKVASAVTARSTHVSLLTQVRLLGS